MLQVSKMVFSVPVISQIESKGGGRAGGGWGEAGVGGKPKVGKAIIQHELIQSTGWAKIAVRSSTLPIGPVPLAVLLMPLRAKKCILIV